MSPCQRCGDSGWVLDWNLSPVRFAVCPDCGNLSKAPKPYIVIESDAPQRTELWERLHIGRLTASEAHKVVTPAKLEYAKGNRTLQYRLAAERLLNIQLAKDLTGNPHIEHGKENEDKAIERYRQIYKVTPRKVSFVFAEDDRTGCSPDALNDADDRYACEVKCPQPPKMVQLHADGPGNDYRIQLLDQFYCARLDRSDLFAYHPWMPPYRQLWKRDDVAKDIATVASHVTKFNDELDKLVDTMDATGFFTRRTNPTPSIEIIREIERQISTMDTVGAIERWEASPEVADKLRLLPYDEIERLSDAARTKREFLALGV